MCGREKHRDLLAEGLMRSCRRAESISRMSSCTVELEGVKSNMGYVRCDEGSAREVASRLAGRGVDVSEETGAMVGAVTHLHSTDEDIDRAIEAFEQSQ